MPPIYLDNNATTHIDQEVALSIQEELYRPPSNPSSVHSFGRQAKSRLIQARQTIAQVLHVKSEEILFTSGGTESMNFLLKGLINPLERPHIITSNVEHASLEETLLHLQKQGCSVTFLPVDAQGLLSIDQIEQAITSQTKLFAFSAANSETGVKQDLQTLSDLALRHEIPLVIDAIALFGKEPFSLYPGITAVGFSAHKFHGPKGVGFVFLRSKTKCRPLLHGGGQEYTLRSGTENLPGILGLAKAVSLLAEKLPKATEHMRSLQKTFEEALCTSIPSLTINGKNSPRVCNVSNITFPGIDAETLLIQLDLQGVAASQGSACSSGALEPSKVLTRMGLSPSKARSSIRFSFSRLNTQEEILSVVKLLQALIAQGS